MKKIQFIILIILLLLAMIIGYIWIWFHFQNFWLALSILTFKLSKLIKYIIRITVFRGCSIWYRNDFERKLAIYSSKTLLNSLTNLESLQDQFGKDYGSELLVTVEQVQSIKRVIESLHTNLKKLSSNGEYFTKEQGVFLEALKSVVGSMKQLEVVSTQAEFSQNLWIIMDNHETLARRYHQFKINDNEGYNSLKKNIKELKGLCTQILYPKTLREKWRNWCKSTLGTQDQLRVEFENDYQCKRHILITKDHSQLDCMILLHSEKNNEADKMEKLRYLEKALDMELKPASNILSNSSSFDTQNFPIRGSSTSSHRNFDEINDLGNFVIICNPNACYYEFTCFDRSLVDFFLSREVNVFLWNYRGYGRTKGDLTFKSQLKDGEEIIDLVRNKIGSKNIALYGRSLGGYIATNLIDKVDQVIVDRSFSSISLIPRIMFNGFIQKVFDFYLDNPKPDLQAFINHETPKIVMYDSTDEIVPQIASLSTGITNEFLNAYLKKDSRSSYTNKTSVSGNNNLAKKVGRSLMSFFKNSSDNDQFYKGVLQNLKMSSQVIGDNDCWIQFQAIRRIFNVIMAVNNKTQNPNKKKKSEATDSDNLNLENLENYMGTEDDDDDEESGFGRKKLELDPDVLQMIHSSDEYERIRSVRDFEKSNFEYNEFINYDDITSEVNRQMNRTLNAQELFESCSTTISDIFVYNSSKFQFPAFRLMILNMALWGSYLPSSAIINASQDTRDPMFSIALNKTKLEEAIKKLEELRDMFQNLSQTASKNKALLFHISDDLRLIVDRLKILEISLGVIVRRLNDPKNITNESKNLLQYGNNSNNQSFVSLNTDENIMSAENLGDHNLDVSISQRNIIKYKNNEHAYPIIKKHINLIPLKCGHNNAASDVEMAMLAKTLFLYGFIRTIGDYNDDSFNLDKFSINDDDE